MAEEAGEAPYAEGLGGNLQLWLICINHKYQLWQTEPEFLALKKQQTKSLGCRRLQDRNNKAISTKPIMIHWSSVVASSGAEDNQEVDMTCKYKISGSRWTVSQMFCSKHIVFGLFLMFSLVSFRFDWFIFLCFVVVISLFVLLEGPCYYFLLLLLLCFGLLCRILYILLFMFIIKPQKSTFLLQILILVQLLFCWHW